MTLPQTTSITAIVDRNLLVFTGQFGKDDGKTTQKTLKEALGMCLLNPKEMEEYEKLLLWVKLLTAMMMIKFSNNNYIDSIATPSEDYV